MDPGSGSESLQHERGYIYIIYIYIFLSFLIQFICIALVCILSQYVFVPKHLQKMNVSTF